MNLVFPQDYEGMLREFQAKYEHYYRTEPGKIPLVVTVLRLRLIIEELAELTQAIENRDRVLIADGLADLAYVVIGSSVAYGTPVTLTKEAITGPISVDILLRHVTKEMGTLACAIHEENIDIVGLSLSRLFTMIVLLSEQFQIPFDPVFREVHASNMTKTPPAEKKAAGAKYASKTGKGKDFRPPELASILGMRA